MVEGTTDNAAGSGGAEASTGNVSSGTASDAMIAAAAAASSAADASAGAAGAVTKPALTTEPAKGAAGTGTDKGPIPFDRHEAAIRNAREEGAREATDKALKQFAWAQGLNPEEVQRKLSVAAQLSTDPRKFYEDLGKELKEHGFMAEPEEKMPEPDIVSPDGKLKTYTADALQKALDIYGKRLTAQLEAKMKPALEFAQTEQGQREQAKATAEARSLAQSTMADLRTSEHFPKGKDGARDAAGEALILEELRAIPANVKAAIGPVAALYKAFESYKTKHVYPTLGAAAEERVRKENDRKAAAAAGHVSSTTNGEGKKGELKNVSDLAAHMERMAAASV